ncbi:hypothetical protein Q4E93_05045 [Flavitalea sp. BT771]|uniref:hypothetical protein n=1 Tax=Flavitalea sp. BT771 TaxID=3063329 RepID=UPI0026E1999C|nr:hypothetical protein [Flavitalea sp. BT771]MDO6429937.1 hypothetical protein [Flavitalea sp. BT771]MDV6217935.1 hypothetical protein [Flavitalea sp. BT771]
MNSKDLFLLCTLLLLSGTQLFANFSQAHWRWRKDNGTETKAAWHAPQDFPSTLPFISGVPLRLRVEVYNSLVNDEKGTASLQYQRGSAGAWITVSNSAGNDFVMAGSSPYVTDGQPTTSLIRDDGAGTFAGGRVLVSTWQFTDTLHAGARKEYEWCIKPTLSLSTDSLYQFRMLFTGTQDAMTYVSPVPDMMYRPNVPITGNAGIYKDSLVTGFFDRDSGWIASDGALSIPLSDGRDFWAMNDSYINNYDTLAGTTGCLFQVRNAGLVQPLNNWTWTSTSTRIGSGPGIPSLFKNNSNDNYLLWPTGGYQQGDTVYVYCSNIMNSSGGLGFTSGGNDFLGKMVMPGLAVAGFDSLQSMPNMTFGVGFDTDEPGNYIYTWGLKGAFITSDIVVARFPRSNPRAHWSFWNGTAWDTAVSHIAPITTGASNGVYCAKVRNKYVLLSTEFSVSCDAGTRIYVATSDSITGPFTNRKVLYTIPDNVLGHSPFFYAPAIHPEYINSKNELLITYDINGYSNCEPACINNGYNPDYYRPRGLRVPLALIDSGITRIPEPVQVSHPSPFGNRWKMAAYPNPAHAAFTVAIEGCSEHTLNLTLLSLSGKAVYRNQIPVTGTYMTKNVYLPPGLGRGLYFLLAQGERSVRWDKIVLE